MAYTQLDVTKPDHTTQNGTQMLQSIRDNIAALRNADIAGLTGWTYSQSGGTAIQPAVVLYTSGVFQIKLTLTWGTTGGANGNVTAVTAEYSQDSGGTWDTVETRSSMTYDASGAFTGGSITPLLGIMMGMPGRLKQSIAAIEARTITADTGLSGGGDLSGNVSLSFDTAWGDARYLPKAGGSLTGNLGVKSATYTLQTAGGTAVDWTAGQRHSRSVSAATTFTFTAPSGPCNLVLKVINTSASARQMSFPGAVKWPSSPPTQAALSTALYLFFYDGTTYWGSFIQGYANA
jgi:hypothetical protein